jgi:hypothetical protein
MLLKHIIVIKDMVKEFSYDLRFQVRDAKTKTKRDEAIRNLVTKIEDLNTKIEEMPL